MLKYDLGDCERGFEHLDDDCQQTIQRFASSSRPSDVGRQQQLVHPHARALHGGKLAIDESFYLLGKA